MFVRFYLPIYRPFISTIEGQLQADPHWLQVSPCHQQMSQWLLLHQLVNLSYPVDKTTIQECYFEVLLPIYDRRLTQHYHALQETDDRPDMIREPGSNLLSLYLSPWETLSNVCVTLKNMATQYWLRSNALLMTDTTRWNAMLSLKTQLMKWESISNKR